MGDVTITNDGATILQKLEVEHPAAKVLVQLADLQDKDVGDDEDDEDFEEEEEEEEDDDIVIDNVEDLKGVKRDGESMKNNPKRAK